MSERTKQGALSIGCKELSVHLIGGFYGVEFVLHTQFIYAKIIKRAMCPVSSMVELSAVNRSVVGSSPTLGAIVAYWRSGLTHMPFTHAFVGSNPA